MLPYYYIIKFYRVQAQTAFATKLTVFKKSKSLIFLFFLSKIKNAAVEILRRLHYFILLLFDFIHHRFAFTAENHIVSDETCLRSFVVKLFACI